MAGNEQKYNDKHQGKGLLHANLSSLYDAQNNAKLKPSVVLEPLYRFLGDTKMLPHRYTPYQCWGSTKPVWVGMGSVLNRQHQKRDLLANDR